MFLRFLVPFCMKLQRLAKSVKEGPNKISLRTAILRLKL